MGASDATLSDWTCDRQELFGADGRRVVAARFGQRAGIGLDPCAAVAATLRLGADQSAECVFSIGYAADAEAARQLASIAVAQDAAGRELAVRTHWDGLLGTVTVQTPDPLFDVLVNRWLLYQTIACRLWARAGFYQAGGAYGFRDQLQDAMALASTAPEMLRRQLLLAASRQFEPGDVQHWWHPPLGAGVRTHMSDDLLWLAHALAHYVQVSGDSAILDERVPFIEGEAAPQGAEDAYFAPQISSLTATLFEHAARAIDHSLRLGAHGLPLMGTGDWNDGMNRVGHQGRGESVWLGFFLCRVVADMVPIAKARGDFQRAMRWEHSAAGWRTALQTVAWDGDWFVRAFFDDGSPLGSHSNAECRIDLVAQAWSVLSGVATASQQRAAMAAAQRLLMSEFSDGRLDELADELADEFADELADDLTDKPTREPTRSPHGLIRLLDPPLVNAVPAAGYIQAYPPGVRENGGQYNHAAVWALMAQAALGDGNAAYQSFTRISPAHRSAHPLRGPDYGLEPYAVAADIYSQPPYAGRGGWSWYTGSAGWLHRAAIESICGLRVRGTSVCLKPCLPGHWPMLRVSLKRDGQRHRFTVCASFAADDIGRAMSAGARMLQAGKWLALEQAGDDSHHLVIVETASSSVADSAVTAAAASAEISATPPDSVVKP